MSSCRDNKEWKPTLDSQLSRRLLHTGPTQPTMLRRVQVLNLIVNTEKIFNLGNGFSIQECTQVGDCVMKFFSILFLILIFHVCQN